MIWAKAAIEGAAKISSCLRGVGPISGLQPVLGRLPVVDIITDKGLLNAMLATTLEVEDVALLDDDLGGDQIIAGFTQARGLAEEEVWGDLTRLSRGCRIGL